MGTVWVFACRHRKNQENLFRDGRSQELTDTYCFYPAVWQTKFGGRLTFPWYVWITIFAWIIRQNSDPIAQKTKHSFITENDPLMLFREAVVYFELSYQTRILCRKNAGFCVLKDLVHIENTVSSVFYIHGSVHRNSILTNWGRGF